METREKWALMDAVMRYGQASRRLGMVSGSRDSEEVAQAAREADQAFEAVLEMVYPKVKPVTDKALEGMERASRELDDARIGALRYEQREDDDVQDNG